MRVAPGCAIAAAMFVFTAPGHARELLLEPAEIRNLGIEFGLPVPVEDVGTIDARARVVIPPAGEHVVSTPRPGLLVRLFVASGDSVAADQVLAEVRSPGFLTLQQEYLEAIHDERLAAAQLGRDEALAAEGIIAHRRLEETRAVAAATASRREEHRMLLILAGMSAEDIAALERDHRFRELLVIRAPADGVILERYAQVGEYVDTADALYRLADLSVLWLDIRIPQEHVGLIRAGMKVAVAGSHAEPLAVVTAVGQAVDSTTQAVPVRAELIAGSADLRPGLLVAVSVVAGQALSSAGKLWSVPTGAVMRSGDRAYVFARTPGGVEAVGAVVVASSGGRVYLRGLDAAHEIAISGVAALKALWLSESDS